MKRGRDAINGDAEWDNSASRAENLTRLLRTSEAALFQGLRDELSAQGLVISELVMADLWPDNPACEFGIVISPPHRVQTFDYYYGTDGDIWTQYRTGRLVNLTDVTQHWTGGTYDAAIREGFGQLPEGA